MPRATPSGCCARAPASCWCCRPHRGRRSACWCTPAERRRELPELNTAELAARLAALPEPMLIVGITGLGDFAARFRGLLTASRYPVLIVHRDAGGKPA